MNQDRKRAFNRAFSPRSGDPFKRAMRSVTASSAVSTPRIFNTPAFMFGSDKENDIPFLQGKGALSSKLGAPKAVFEPQQAFVPHFSQAHMRLPLGTHSLHNCSELQHTGNIFGAQNYTTTPMQFEQEWFGSSPPGFTSDPASSSPANDVLGSYLDSEPGPVIFEDPDNAMCGQLNHDPLTPSALHFDDLSLQEVPKRTLSVQPSPSMRGAQRTHVFMMRTSVFEPCFPNLLPNEVIIAFDKGKQVMKVDKYPICASSRFFTSLLNQPFVDGQTPCIRLRDDFPYAIAAMIQFVEDGIYIFNPDMRAQYPNITLLDLHVHAYVVGAKYDLPALCEHAVDEYVNVAGMVMSMGIPPDMSPSSNNSSTPVSAQNSNFPNNMPTGLDDASKDPSINPATTVFNSFLDSLTLIWRNTPNRVDALRQAVLELIKPEINTLMRLSFFQTLMQDMVGFCDDIMYSLEDDGFDVLAFPVQGKGQATGVRFGGA